MNPSLGPESPASSPDLQLMASGREAGNFHVVRVGNVRGAVGSDCNVVAESARRWQRIPFLERSRLQVEGLQGRRRLLTS